MYFKQLTHRRTRYTLIAEIQHTWDNVGIGASLRVYRKSSIDLSIHLLPLTLSFQFVKRPF